MQHLTQMFPPEMEAARRRTWRGMFHFATDDESKRCGGCRHYGDGICGLFHAAMKGQRRKHEAVPHDAVGCKYWSSK